MKKPVLVSLLMVFLPFLVMAQSNDDLYFIPKKKTEKKVTSGIPAKVVIEKEKTPTTVYTAPGSTVVVKDVEGNLRDVDEYNRRYTSRDNTFSMENDTLYIEEKPYNERGEWVNGFEGSQSDYEYAMRIIRFRNPRYAIPVSSPLYWEVVYTLPSWEWNVFDDGYYAYAFPTYTNRLWWDWRFDYSWGWRSSWYYNSWYGPRYWYGSYWGGWPHYHHHHHHHYPHYAWGGVGGYWGGGHGWNGSSARNPGIHASRYTNNYGTSGSSSRRVVTTGNRNSRNNYVNGVRQNNNRNEGTVRSSGRVVTAKDGSSSVRPQRSAVRGRDNSSYTRQNQGKSSSYTRQSSTRSTVNNTGSSSYQRKSGAAERGAYRNNSSSRSSENRSSYNSSRSSSSRSSYSSGSSSSRSSYSSGSGSSSRSSVGNGGSRSGGGGRR